MQMNPSNFPRASDAFKKANPHIFGDLGNDLALGRGPTEKKTGIRRGGKKMNKTEQEFSWYLDALQSRGEIKRFVFQGATLLWGVDEKTSEAMRYTPDFVVIPIDRIEHDRRVTDGGIRMIEIKGSKVIYQQQALARFKGCRSDWPEFEFEMWQKTKEEGWKRVL